jgi:hypothetical protein
VSKETYYSVKRDLLQCQKRPTNKINEYTRRKYAENKEQMNQKKENTEKLRKPKIYQFEIFFTFSYYNVFVYYKLIHPFLKPTYPGGGYLLT